MCFVRPAIPQHSQKHYFFATFNIPAVFRSFLTDVQFLERKELIHVFLYSHRFFPDKVILREKHILIWQKSRSSRNRCHDAQQAVLKCKASYCFLFLAFGCFLAHAKLAYINSIQCDILKFLYRIVRLRHGIRCRLKILYTIRSLSDNIITVPHPY